eukprot:1940151-Alexandrium_andersonii.AAC.1
MAANLKKVIPPWQEQGLEPFDLALLRKLTVGDGMKGVTPQHDDLHAKSKAIYKAPPDLQGSDVEADSGPAQFLIRTPEATAGNGWNCRFRVWRPGVCKRLGGRGLSLIHI